MAKYEECVECERRTWSLVPGDRRAVCSYVNGDVELLPSYSVGCRAFKQKEKKITKGEVLRALDVAIEDPTCSGIDCSPGARCDNDGRGCCPELVRRIEALKKARAIVSCYTDKGIWGTVI